MLVDLEVFYLGHLKNFYTIQYNTIQSKTAKIHRFVTFVMYCFITTVPVEFYCSGVSVSVFDVGIGIRYRYFKISWYRYRYSVYAIEYNFWSNKATGPPVIPVLKKQHSPAKEKIPQKFLFGKMLDFACSKTISTQTSDIYWNQLQRYGQFAEVYMYMPLEVLSLEIYPNVTNSFPPVPHVETDRQRSITVVPANTPCPNRRHPDTASP